MILMSGQGTARDTTVSLSGAGVEGDASGGDVVVKMMIGDGGLVGQAGGSWSS